MRYSTEPRFRKYVKGNGFLSCAKKFNIYGEKLMDTATKATGDLIGNKIADKITSIAKPKEKQKAKETGEIYIPQEKRQQNIDDFRLFWA